MAIYMSSFVNYLFRVDHLFFKQLMCFIFICWNFHYVTSCVCIVKGFARYEKHHIKIPIQILVCGVNFFKCIMFSFILSVQGAYFTTVTSKILKPGSCSFQNRFGTYNKMNSSIRLIL